MKKPTKEQRAVWSRNYAVKHRETIARKRKVLNPIKNNETEIQSAQSNERNNSELFCKSYFGKRNLLK